MHDHQKQTHTFEKKDRWGEAHYYVVTLHRATEGTKIALEIIGLLGPTIGAAVKNMMSEGHSPVALLNAFDGEGDEDNDTVVEALDIPAITAELQRALMRPESYSLVRKLVSQTTRDGKDLKQAGEFDMAFKANYLELVQVLWEVVQLNGFLPLSST